jgi:hypothetical protein
MMKRTNLNLHRQSARNPGTIAIGRPPRYSNKRSFFQPLLISVAT